jgi:hypothetical protein
MLFVFRPLMKISIATYVNLPHTKFNKKLILNKSDKFLQHSGWSDHKFLRGEALPR